MKGERKVRKLKLKYTCNYSRKHRHNIAREIESLRGEEGRRAKKEKREKRGEKAIQCFSPDSLKVVTLRLLQTQEVLDTQTRSYDHLPQCS